MAVCSTLLVQALYLSSLGPTAKGLRFDDVSEVTEGDEEPPSALHPLPVLMGEPIDDPFSDVRAFVPGGDLAASKLRFGEFDEEPQDLLAQSVKSIDALSSSRSEGGNRHPDAVVYIAGGPIAAKMLFASSVQTLAQIGRWRRPVVVLTDRPGCVRSNVLPRAKALNVDLRIVTIPKPPKHLPKYEWRDKKHAKKYADIMHYQSFKTKIFDYMEEAGLSSFKRVLYMDEDIVIGRDMEDLANSIPGIATSPGIMCFGQPTQKGWGDSERFHTGIILFTNSSSVRDCLSDWTYKHEKGKYMFSAVFPRDQASLMNSTCVTENLVGLLPTALFMFPDNTTMANNESRLFNHFTNTNRMHNKKWKPAIRQYFSSVMRIDTDDLDPWGNFSCEAD